MSVRSAAGARAPVPPPTVQRLTTYRGALVRLRARAQSSVSSAELARSVGVNAATLRRDLSHLGSFGVRGAGYAVDHLLEQIDRELGLDRSWPVAILGAGNLGRALARSRGFNSGGFFVAALLDVQPSAIGTTLLGLRIEHLDDLDAIVAARGIAVGVITTPAGAAQAVAERLVAAGVVSILNFAPTVVLVPPPATVRQVDLAGELAMLTYYGARQVRASR